MKNSKIKKISAREILDSRGNPTVEVELETDLGIFKASVPSGTSAGKYEAFELRDGGTRYNGRGVLKAVKNINEIISPALKDKLIIQQKKIDELMINLDGTQNKLKLGANAMLSVSLAVCRAGAATKNIPLWKYINQLAGEEFSPKLPTPSLLVIEGGKHAGNSLNFQEFMILPDGKSFEEKLRRGTGVYYQLGLVLEKKYGKSATNVGFEGGFAAPSLKKAEEVLNFIIKAIKELKLEKQIKIAIDAAASSFSSVEKYNFEEKEFTRKELLNCYSCICERYPVVSIEDPFGEEDNEGFRKITEKLGKKITIIGDDFLVTNPDKIKKAVKEKLCNGVILKPNQIGTITETFDAAKIALKNNWKIIVSHRAGDTCDDFIADLAVGLAADFIKAGAPARGERVAKYNRLLKIEKELRIIK